MDKKSVLYVTNIPSPYRVKYFNILSNYYKLTVIYERPTADDRDINWSEENNNKYEIIFLKGIKHNNDSTISNGVKKYLEKNKCCCVVFCDYSTISGMIGIDYCIKNNISYFVECDGAFYQKNLIKDIIKRKMLSNAMCCLSTCNNLDNYYSKLGVKSNRIERYRFTSLSNKEMVFNSSQCFGINRLKKRLGLGYPKILLFVGQFIYRKGIDVLLNAAVYLPKDVGVVIVGGEPTIKYIDIIEHNDLPSIHFFPFKTKEQLSDFFRIADVFVLPTREDIWGLVVNEALSFGLPVITTNRCNAGLELIKDGYNGYVIKPDSVDELVEAINKLLSSEHNLRNNCIESIQDYTIENMVKDHIDIFNKYGK